ncbi:hypothetical protein J4402_04960 [Candidatus Pacearchaeota archaeon]|nr:hypothetical protein [Candidatus Pacearchaeota archaeon]
MISASYEALRKLGFQELRKGPGWTGPKILESVEKWDGEYLGLIRNGIQIIAEKIKEGVYAVKKARDRNAQVYKEQDIETSETFRGTETIPGLITLLEDPKRWEGINEQTRGLLHQIANAPSEAKAGAWINQAISEIKKYKDPISRSRAEIEFEGAITAMQTNHPERYSLE